MYKTLTGPHRGQLSARIVELILEELPHLFGFVTIELLHLSHNSMPPQWLHDQ